MFAVIVAILPFSAWLVNGRSASENRHIDKLSENFKPDSSDGNADRLAEANVFLTKYKTDINQNKIVAATETGSDYLLATSPEKSMDYGPVHVLTYDSSNQADKAAADLQSKKIPASSADVEFHVALGSNSGQVYPYQMQTQAKRTAGNKADEPLIALIDTGDDNADKSVNLTRESDADRNGHGTRMDKLIREGAGKEVQILSIKAFSDEGTANLSDMAAALCYAVDSGADIINISATAEATQHGREVLQVLVDEAFQKGITIVAAAGNSSADAVDYMPACLNHVITVGAADETGKLSSYSNYGENVDLYVKGEKYTSSAAAKITGYIAGSSEAALSSHQDITVKAKGIQTEKNGFPASADPASEPEAKNTKASDAVDTASAETESTPAVEEKAEESADPDPDEDNKSEASAESESISFEEVPAEETTVLDKDTREESTIEPEEKKQTMDESAGKDNEKPIENAEATDDKETDQSSETEKSALPADTAAPAGAQENDDDEFKVNDGGGQKHATGYIENLDDDDEYIEMFKILEQQDGTPFDHGNGKMWDDNDDPGNDSGPNNNVVMTYDTINYTLQLTSAPYTDGAYYRHGYIRFRMVLPASETEAQFVTGDMGWMVNGTGTNYDYKVVKETIDGKECQVLYCSMYLSADAAGTPNVFPCVKQTANVSIEVRNMKNGDYLQPKFYCWMDHNETNGTCATHGKNEVMEADSGNIRVSARPSYNIVIGAAGHNPTMMMNFATGNATAPNKELGKQHGTNFVFGAMLELRNDGTCPNKMLKGVEAPTGDITYDIDTTLYFEKANGSMVDVTNDPDVRAVVYCVELNDSNEMGRPEPSSEPHGNTGWPYGSGAKVAYSSTWSHASYSYQNHNLSMNLSSYTVDDRRFPSSQIYGNRSSTFYNYADYGKGARYTERGIFSVYQYDIALLYDTNTLVQKYGEGSLGIKCKLKNIKTTSLSGSTNGSNVITGDDTGWLSADLHPPGTYTHMMTYSSYQHGWTWNVQDYGPDHYNLSDSVGIIGQKFRIGSLNANYDVESDFKLGDDRLVKFNAAAFTPIQDSRSDVVFAAKKDGTDWKDENEKSFAKIEDLIYYKTYSELVADGKKCVGILFSWRKTYWVSGWQYTDFPMKINVDQSLVKTVQSIETYSYAYHVDLTKHDLSDISMVPSFRDAIASGISLPTVPDNVRVTSLRVGSYRKAVYDTTTDIMIDSGTNDFQRGDSMYIEGYMAKITKTTAQSTNGSPKNVYNLDNGEKIVDYSLSPYINMATPVSMNTEVMVTDTIPAGMAYNNDATYGGTYVKGVTDGAHGSVEDGTVIDAASTKIKKNADGTTTVVWTLHNIDITKPIPTIRYSATIDVNAAVNGKNYTSRASVKTTEDQRSPSVANQNISDFTISVVKLSGFSLTKLSDKEIYEIPDDISWTMTWNNLSKNAEPDILMMDMMPYNGDSFGSNYHGSYTVKSLKLDLDTPSAYTFWYTTDESYRSKSTRDITSDDVRANWAQGNIASDGTVSCLNGKTPVAWGFIGTLNGNTSLVGHITIQTTGAKADDDYYNESSMMKAVVSGHSAYVSHNLSGYVFIDTDKDGFKDDTETVLKGVTATLYEKGNHTKPVTNIDGKACVTTTDDKGYYEFTNISKRDYDVVFTKDDLSLYTLTPKYADHEGWTNKATHEDDDSNSLARDMYIDSAIDRSLEAQQRDVLSRITYRVDYTQVNLGVYQRASKVMIQKIDTDGKILPGADLQIADSDGHVLADWTSSKDPFTWTLTWGKTYTVTETKAPAGHALTAGSVSIQINKNGKLVVNGKAVDGYKITLADADTLHILSTGGSGTAVFVLTGSILIFVAALQILSRRKKNLQA